MPTSEILFVKNEEGDIDRYHGYRAAAGKMRSGDAGPELERVCRGVYKPEELPREAWFQTYGLRLANYLFPKASLSYSCAFNRTPVLGRVFITGQYQYRRPLFQSLDRFVIVQSIGKVDENNRKLHTWETFKDPYGKFKMLVDTPELTLLNLFEPTKRYAEKHLSERETNALVTQLLAKHGSDEKLKRAVKRVAEMAERPREYECFLKREHARELDRVHKELQRRDAQ